MLHCCSWDLTLTAVRKGTPGVDRRDLLLLGHLLVLQDLQTQEQLKLGLPAPGFPLPGSWSVLQVWAPVGLEGLEQHKLCPHLCSLCNLCQRQHGASGTSAPWHQFRVSAEAKQGAGECSGGQEGPCSRGEGSRPQQLPPSWAPKLN